VKRNLYIDGNWCAAEAGGTFDVIDPADETTFATVAAATAPDINRAVVAARRAFDGGEWSCVTGKQRGAVLHGIAASIRVQRESLAELEVRDNGKPLPEALWDIDDTGGCFEFYANLAAEADSAWVEKIQLADARFSSKAVREPVGVVGAIVLWSYPMLMAAWKVAPALAAGCTVVLKPSELSPMTAYELAAIAHDVALPPGVLNVVSGLGPEAGQALADHSGVDKLAFTGSVTTGRKVMAAAARDIKRVSLELGGKSPFLVFADSDLDKAVEWIMFGIFWNQGQVCSATSRVLVERAIYEPLLGRLAEAAAAIPIGNGMQPGVKLGPLISAGQLAKVQAAVAEGKRAGARLVHGGERPQHLKNGYFLQPTIFAEAPLNSAIWREEVFGPVVSLRPFDSEAEAVRLANDSRFGLAAAIMSADDVRCDRVAAGLRAGIVWINCSQPTFVEAPWGGFKQSGIGRELGRWGFENYLETKQITRYDSPDPWGWYS
jgi:betaine-aldehyde dehydrogenase